MQQIQIDLAITSLVSSYIQACLVWSCVVVWVKDATKAIRIVPPTTTIFTLPIAGIRKRKLLKRKLIRSKKTDGFS